METTGRIAGEGPRTVHSLPRKAQVFLVMTWLLGVLAVTLSSLLPGFGADAEMWELGLFILLGALAGRTKVQLMRRMAAENTGFLSLGFVIIFAALLHLGPAAAMLVGATTTLCSCLFPKRQPLHQMAFNVALNASETFCAGWLFLLINGGTLDLERFRSFAAVMASSLAFFLISTVAVATAIALSTH